MIDKNKALTNLKKIMDTYTLISDITWEDFKTICSFQDIKKGDALYKMGEIPTSFAFVNKGLFRSYILDDKGSEYNKMFFSENYFPGTMVSLLTKSPSNFEIQALEDSNITLIDFKKYRELLLKYEDLKLFQIYYLEKNWLTVKEAKEVDIIQKDAKERYEEFLEFNSDLEKRLPQYHIASHLGVTPTQLSRIRKSLQNK